jgi:hypothetical protein
MTLHSIPEPEVDVTWFLSAITMDTIIKQTKQIKIQECLAILDINNDSSVVILQLKLREFFVENILG